MYTVEEMIEKEVGGSREVEKRRTGGRKNANRREKCSRIKQTKIKGEEKQRD